MTRIWIGPRESDILNMGGYFNKSITFYGSNNTDNFAFCTKTRSISIYDDDYYEHIFDSLDTIMKDDDDPQVHFYTPAQAYKLITKRPEYAKYFKWTNDELTLEWFNNKTYTRLWLENFVSVPESLLLGKAQCSYNMLTDRFSGENEFILQLNHSSGGKGTFKMNEQNAKKVYDELPFNEPLLVAPYYANSLSANCHMIIGENENILFQSSMQIINVQDDKMIYSGGNFLEGKNLDNTMGQKLYAFKSMIADCISKTGYRGVCGIDFLVTEDEDIILIEINPRYQGSTYFVNQTLTDNDCPHLSALSESAFTGSGLIKDKKTKSKTWFSKSTVI